MSPESTGAGATGLNLVMSAASAVSFGLLAVHGFWTRRPLEVAAGVLGVVLVAAVAGVVILPTSKG